METPCAQQPPWPATLVGSTSSLLFLVVGTGIKPFSDHLVRQVGSWRVYLWQAKPVHSLVIGLQEAGLPPNRRLIAAANEPTNGRGLQPPLLGPAPSLWLLASQWFSWQWDGELVSGGLAGDYVRVLHAQHGLLWVFVRIPSGVD